MSENRKFAALAGLRQHSTELAEVPPLAFPQRSKAGPGRPAGKRSNPNFQPTTVLLRKDTKKTATRKLEDTNSGQDLSELIEHLLVGWIKAS